MGKQLSAAQLETKTTRLAAPVVVAPEIQPVVEGMAAGTPLGRVTAQLGRGVVRNWTVANMPAGFGFDFATGDVLIADPSLIDHATASQSFSTIAFDGYRKSASADVLFNVVAKPVALPTIQNINPAPIVLPEDSTIGTAVPITLVVDELPSGVTVPATGAWALSADPENKFAINADTGAITIDQTLDFEADQSHPFTVQCVLSDATVLTAGFNMIVGDVSDDESLGDELWPDPEFTTGLGAFNNNSGSWTISGGRLVNNGASGNIGTTNVIDTAIDDVLECTIVISVVNSGSILFAWDGASGNNVLVSTVGTHTADLTVEQVDSLYLWSNSFDGEIESYSVKPKVAAPAEPAGSELWDDTLLTIGGGWSYDTGTDTATSAGGLGSIGMAGVDGPLVIGRQYRCRVTVSNYVSGTLNAGWDGVTSPLPNPITADGQVDFTFRANGTSIYLSSNAFVGDVSGISVKSWADVAPPVDPPVAGDADLWVTATGTGDGLTEGNPMSWEAALAAAQPGQVIGVKAGHYGARTLHTPRGGTAENPIRFVGYTSTMGDSPAYPAGYWYANATTPVPDSALMPVFEAASTENDIFGILAQHPYVHFEGFTITKFNWSAYCSSSFCRFERIYTIGNGKPSQLYSGYGIFLNGPDNTVVNCHCANANAQLLTASGARSTVLDSSATCNDSSTLAYATDYYLPINSSGSLVDNCDVYRHGNLAHGGHGIEFKPVNGASITSGTIQNCRAYNMDSGGFGVRHGQVSGCIIQDNEVYDGQGILIREGANNNTIRRNYIDVPGGMAFWLADYGEDPGTNPLNRTGYNNLCEDNTVNRAKYLIAYRAGDAGAAAVGNVFDNLTVTGAVEWQYFGQTPSSDSIVNSQVTTGSIQNRLTGPVETNTTVDASSQAAGFFA